MVIHMFFLWLFDFFCAGGMAGVLLGIWKLNRFFGNDLAKL